MTYHVYENFKENKAKIHFSNCPYCNNGKGTHRTVETENGQWLGPFQTFQEARRAAERTRRMVSECKHCKSQ